MKVMKTTLAAVFLCLSCLTSTTWAGPNQSCSISIPAGTIIRVYPDERIIAGTTSGPLLFTVAADVRFFVNKAPILPRGSKILGKMESSNQAGRFWGRAKARVLFTSILTPDFCEYPIEAKLIEAKNHQVRDEVIVGRGHAKRDVLALLFPPTTVYQLLRLPSRGPKLTMDEEAQLTIKIMQPIHQARAEGVAPPVSNYSRQEYPSTPLTAAATNIPGACSKISRGFFALPRWSRIQRSFENSTPYEVVVYGNGSAVGRVPPCSQTILFLPRGGIKLKAIATIPEDYGQHEVEAVLGVNDSLTGWQILSVNERTSQAR